MQVPFFYFHVGKKGRRMNYLNILKNWERKYYYVHIFAQHTNIPDEVLENACLNKITKSCFTDEKCAAYILRILLHGDRKSVV